MKKINFEGEDWWYKIQYESGSLINYYYTEFYKNPTKSVKKWLFWGDLEEIENDKPNFLLFYNIEDPIYSKEIVKELIAPMVKREKRKLEIEKGEII